LIDHVAVDPSFEPVEVRGVPGRSVGLGDHDGAVLTLQR
jgi:hypothetical protein